MWELRKLQQIAHLLWRFIPLRVTATSYSVKLWARNSRLNLNLHDFILANRKVHSLLHVG
jgi:hypothetical protein